MRSLDPILRSLAARIPSRCGARGLTLVSLLLWGVTAARAAGPGQWTPSVDWSGGVAERYAVHLALLPGEGAPYDSRVLWWHGENPSTFWGGLWGWKPGNESCGAFPSASFVSLSVPRSGVNLFCSGHTLLDGRLLVVSGHDSVTQEYGERRARIFSADSCGAPSRWSDPGLMGSWRWYPSATGLRDGRVLVTAGSTYPYQRVFGGARDGLVPASPVGDSLYRFVGAGSGRWDPAGMPGADQITGERPAPRAGHTAAQLDGVPWFGAQVFFGGRKPDSTALNDAWLLVRDPNHLGADFGFTWSKVRPPQGVLPPPPRSDHSAVAFPLDTTMMVVYGGLGNNNVVRSDVWRLYPDGLGLLTWKEVTTLGAGPGARYGQAALYDASTIIAGGDTTLRQRMIVFGGASAPGQPAADDTVRELRFDHLTADTATWYAMPQVTGGAAPPPRYWHRMIGDPTLRPDAVTGQRGHVALMYGGALGATPARTRYGRCGSSRTARCAGSARAWRGARGRCRASARATA